MEEIQGWNKTCPIATRVTYHDPIGCEIWGYPDVTTSLVIQSEDKCHYIEVRMLNGQKQIVPVLELKPLSPVDPKTPYRG